MAKGTIELKLMDLDKVKDLAYECSVYKVALKSIVSVRNRTNPGSYLSQIERIEQIVKEAFERTGDEQCQKTT